jgi:hypothetical protein
MKAPSPGVSRAPGPPAAVNGPHLGVSRAPGPSPWGLRPQMWTPHPLAPPPIAPPPPARHSPQHAAPTAGDSHQHLGPPPFATADARQPWGSLPHVSSGSSELAGPHDEQWEDVFGGLSARDSIHQGGEGFGQYGPPEVQRHVDAYNSFGAREAGGDLYGGQGNSLYAAQSNPGGGTILLDGRQTFQGSTVGNQEGFHGHPDHRQSTFATADPRQAVSPPFDAATGLRWETHRQVQGSQNNAPEDVQLTGYGGWVPGEQISLRNSQESRPPEPQAATEKPQSFMYSDLSATARHWVPAGAKPELWPEVQNAEERTENLHRWVMPFLHHHHRRSSPSPSPPSPPPPSVLLVSN